MNPACVDSSHGLVGESQPIRQIRKQIEKLGRSRSPALLLGESGTGKEVVARAIHNVNACGNFIPIDCGSLVGPLMESELFGHTRGAFTGAAEAKRGLIELADGGTAFFDEIGDLPVEMQVKLLRLLQEREFRPVGSLTQRKVEIRVIAATHRDLIREVERGTFRLDLFYRLNVVTIHLPPLRDRLEDITVLAGRFLDRHAPRYTLTNEALDAMLSYDWPGNVRELQNCIERMVTMNSGPLLHVSDLPSAVQHHLAARRAAQMSVAVSADPGPLAVPRMQAIPPSGIIPLMEMERQAILQALEYTKGDRVIAAHLLGIGRTTLYRKLKEYRLDS
ncbi:MAG: sigma-54-dependent Fis family transcriptional regulator [Candidatus Solibacter usitatus]|nr:sigma-54-dependent Fis family transcriptional regulator [Candidatus Solibacter usitatus]